MMTPPRDGSKTSLILRSLENHDQELVMESQAIAAAYRAAAEIRAGKEPQSAWIGCCACCAKPISKPRFCSACHAVRYCSRDCQVSSWKGQSPRADKRGGFWLQGHKDECATIKGLMAELPDVHAILKQFPWGRLESNGGFNYLVALASRDLLGEGSKFGWWIQPLPDQGLTVKKLYTSNGPPRGLFLDSHGAILLSDEHLKQEAGWKLPAAEIPWLTFSEGRKPPSFPPTFEHSWAGYYEWRGLPLESPAALLLHWPMTIYHLLHRLGYVPSNTEMASSKRCQLTVHCIGVESELNCIPVFGELALLFPNTDIDLVMYGASAYKIAQHAKPTALAARQYVYEFRAPEECGSGSIRIQLYKESECWDGRHISSLEMIPNTLIALNAGVSTFDTWRSVFQASRLYSIPFAVTDYNKTCLHQDEIKYESWLEMLKPMLQAQDGTFGGWKMQLLAKSVDYQPSSVLKSSALNPFMRPGNIAMMTNRVPSGINAFSCIVTPCFQ